MSFNLTKPLLENPKFKTLYSTKNVLHSCGVQSLSECPPALEPLVELHIDPEFKALIPPLSSAEYQSLQASLIREGCRDALVVWQEEGILVDGHNRYDICSAHSIPFSVVMKSFPDRTGAMDWMIDTQLGRRNLPPMLLRYLRGKRYLLEKHQGQRRDLTCAQNEQKLTTAQRLARQYGVSPQTIRRDASLASDVDTLRGVLSTDIRQNLLGGGSKLTQRETRELAALARRSPEKAASLLATQLRGQHKSTRKSSAQATSGISYTPGVGCEYKVLVSAGVWEQLNSYREDVGVATLGGAVARLLDEVKSQPAIREPDTPLPSVVLDSEVREEKVNSLKTCQDDKEGTAEGVESVWYDSPAVSEHQQAQKDKVTLNEATISIELTTELMLNYNSEELYGLIVEAENIAVIIDSWLKAPRETREQVRQVCPGIELVMAGKFAQVHEGNVPRALASRAENDRSEEIDWLKKENQALVEAAQKLAKQVQCLSEQLQLAQQTNFH